MKLSRVQPADAQKCWEMQVEAFQDIYAKYQDTETNPAMESFDHFLAKFNRPSTYSYFIEVENQTIGAIRVVDGRALNRLKRISPLFIMKEYRNRGYAQQAIQLVEEIYGSSNWELKTIFEEKGNCYLYEKMGYRKTGETKKVNEKMTLVCYRKD